MYSPYFSVLYCSMLKAREDSRILGGKAQIFERLVASKSVNNTVNRRKKHSLFSHTHKGAVVQVAFTFILLVVLHNKPLQCVEEQDCKLYTLCHGTH
jgi:hypothetical protein